MSVLYKGVLLESRELGLTEKTVKNKEIRTTAAKILRAAESFCHFIITCSLLTPALISIFRYSNSEKNIFHVIGPHGAF